MCSSHMIRQRTAALVGAVAVLTVVGALTGAVGASPTADSASPHGAENGNYTADLPFNTDHYPRNENPGGPYNASINHYAGFTKQQFDEKGAPMGVEELDFIIVSNQDVDFSQCQTENTAAFGVDRDSSNPGTETDIDLLRYRENSLFNEHSIVIEFFDDEDLAGPNPEDRGGPGEEPWTEGEGREDGDGDPEVYPDDQIVAHQGYRSGGGPCYGMPEEPGWYQFNSFGNGTSFSGEEVVVDTESHYVYICECDSEAEAREQLGPPPSEQGDGSTESTATATATATPMPDGSDGTERTATETPTETATETPTETATETSTAEPDGSGGGGGDDSNSGDSDGGDSDSGDSGDSGDSDGGDSDSGDNASRETATATATAGGSDDGGQANQQQDQQQQAQQPGAGPATPTVGAGPGFGAVAALAGALLTGLLALRRR